MRHVYVLPLLLIGVFSHSVHASSAIYKWVDQNGTTQYTQTPPPKNAKSSKTVRVSKHIPADVREGRAKGMVDAATLQAYTAPNTLAQPSPPEQALINAREAATDAAAASPSNPAASAPPAVLPPPPIVRPATQSPLIPLNNTGVDTAQ